METLLRQLDDLRPETVASEWERRDLAQIPDAILVGAIVSLLAPPKDRQSTSFQLHAPLELLARVALLPWVEPRARQRARQKIVELGVRYAHSAEPAALSAVGFSSAEAARAALLAAFSAGDADTADAALVSLLDREPLAATLAALRPLLVDHLGAAAHAPILVAELPRVVDRIPAVAQLLRAPLRSLLHHPAHLGWHRVPASSSSALDRGRAAQLLGDRLAAPPRVTSPSTSIAPTMLSVEQDGLAAELLAGPCAALDAATAERLLSRIAAAAMLREPETHAPYGWTHALTLPQAMLRMTASTSDEAAGVAMAATYVLGFRATLGAERLEPSRDLPPPTASPDERRTQLATAAAQHTDAHFAKYVVAVFDAASRDPEAEHLYLSAAERLAAFWARR